MHRFNIVLGIDDWLEKDRQCCIDNVVMGDWFFGVGFSKLDVKASSPIEFAGGVGKS